MDKPSLRTLRIPPKLFGEPKRASEDVLRPVFEVASTLVFVLPRLDLELLAQLTCGVGPFMRAGTKVSIVFLRRADNPIPLLEEASAATQTEALAAVDIQHRLSFFRYFADSNALHIAIRSIPRTDERFMAFMEDNVGTTLLDDAQGTVVSIQWHEPIQLREHREIAATLRWSFGDPLKRVAIFNETINTSLAVPSPPEVAAAEQILQSFVESLPEPEKPWQEIFETGRAPSLTLFKHQEAAVNAWFANGKRGIFKMCTGAGKTIASLACISAPEYFSSQTNTFPPVLVTVPTRVLADQWIEQMKRMGFPYILRAYESSANWLGILEPWMKAKSTSFPRFAVSTYKTFADQRFLAKLTRLGDSGILGTWIADEMHNLASAALVRAMEAVGRLFPNRIGLSATPEIEGNLPITERLMRFFNGICATYELVDGIRDGVLCPYRYHPFPAYLDPQRGEEYLQTLRGIEGAENQPHELMEFYRKSREIVRTSGIQLPAFESMLDSIIAKENAIKHTLVYCPPGFSDVNADLSDDVHVDEAQRRLLEEVVAACRRRNISVASIIGETPAFQRNEILGRFASGDVEVLCAIGCLDEGVDVPSIKRAIVLYSIDRERQFVQRRGRILRQPKGVKKIADIHDVIILPHGTVMDKIQAQRLLHKELRRYQVFSDLALNVEAATKTIQDALITATTR